MSQPQEVKPGDPIRAEDWNALSAVASAAGKVASGWGTGATIQSGGQSGTRISSQIGFQVSLFEAMADFAIGTTQGVADDIPSGSCKNLWYHPVGFATTPNEYATAGTPIVVYDHDVANPRKLNDQFFAVFNLQSGRWEVLAAKGGSGGGTKLVKVIEQTTFPTGNGPTTYYAVEQDVVAGVTEGGPITISDTTDFMWVHSFRPNVIVKDVRYLAHEITVSVVGGGTTTIWVIDNQMTWQTGM